MIQNKARNKGKSYLFVALQFFCLGYLFLSGPLLAGPLYLLILELAGIALGVWAVLVMGIGNFNITPDPLTSAKLVKRGPYLLIRHPMYLALLLTTLPLILSDFNLLRSLVWVLLFVTLFFKMDYEEQLLLSAFPQYRKYRDHSYRILPGLY